MYVVGNWPDMLIPTTATTTTSDDMPWSLYSGYYLVKCRDILICHGSVYMHEKKEEFAPSIMYRYRRLNQTVYPICNKLEFKYRTYR